MNTSRPSSSLVFILKSLMPYSRENLMLSFSPNRYFNELEKRSGYKRKTLEEAARRAERRGLIAKRRDHSLRLTALGENYIKPYTAQKLASGAKLMVIFDIPETKASARRQLRYLLRRWDFAQVQKSVWTTAYDHRESVKAAVMELEITSYVRIYECEPLPLDK